MRGRRVGNCGREPLRYLDSFDRDGHIGNVIVVYLGDRLIDAAPFLVLSEDTFEAFLVNDETAPRAIKSFSEPNLREGNKFVDVKINSLASSL